MADRTIIAQIVRERRALHAKVQLVDENALVKAVRNLRSAPGQCDELVAAMSLAISIAIDPSRGNRGDVSAHAAEAPAIDQSPSGDPTPEPAQASSAAPTRARGGTSPQDSDLLFQASRSARARPPPFGLPELSATLAITSAVGVAPALALGLAASVGARWSRASLAVEGRHDFSASGALVGGGEARTSLSVGSLVACVRARVFLGCAVGSLGALRGEGVGLPRTRGESVFYAATGGRIGADIPLGGRLYLRPHVDALATLARTRLQVDGVARWTAPASSIVAAIGVGVRFP
jgi:hypothetical protein